MDPRTIRCLVTGGAGFVGGTLAKKLAERAEYEVVAVDSLLTGDVHRCLSDSGVQFIKADVNDIAAMSAIMTSRPFDVVFHYAAMVGVQRTLEHPTRVLEDIDGIRNVLELSKNTGVKRVFYSSSSEVYGEPVEIPQHEERTPLNARLPYAVVKGLGECYCKAYGQEHGLPYTVLRFFNTYGPTQTEDFVVPRFVRRALENKPIEIYGNGEQTRTFCYVDDNVDFTMKVLEDGLFVNDVVNIGHHEQVSIKDLAKLVIEETRSNSKIVHLEALPEGDMTRRQPDNSRMRSILDRELVSLRQGIAKIMEVSKQAR